MRNVYKYKVFHVTVFILLSIVFLLIGCERTSPVSIKWTYYTGNNCHFFEIVDDVLYVSYMSGNLYAIDKHTGKEKWKYSDRDGGFINCSVANGVIYLPRWDENVWDENVYIEEQTYLFAIDSEDGEFMWRYNLGENLWYLYEIQPKIKPIVANGIVYIGGPNDQVFAIDVDSHELHWLYNTEFEYAYPNVCSIVSVANGMVSFFTRQAFYVVDITSDEAKMKWEKEGDVIYAIRAATIAGDVAYIGVDIVGNSNEKDYLFAIDMKNSDIKWRYETGRVDFSPVVVDGVIYFGSRDRFLYALDADTGELLWKYKMSEIAMSSPTVNNETVYIGCTDHKLYAVEANSGELLWKFKTGGSVYSSIIVEDNIVYFGSSDGHLYALEITGESLELTGHDE